MVSLTLPPDPQTTLHKRDGLPVVEGLYHNIPKVEFRTLSQVVTLLKLNTRQAKAEGESSSGWTSLKKATKAKAFSNAGGDTLILI